MLDTVYMIEKASAYQSNPAYLCVNYSGFGDFWKDFLKLTVGYSMSKGDTLSQWIEKISGVPHSQSQKAANKVRESFSEWYHLEVDRTKSEVQLINVRYFIEFIIFECGDILTLPSLMKLENLLGDVYE